MGIYLNLFTYFLVNRHVGYFQTFVIMNAVAKNILIQDVYFTCVRVPLVSTLEENCWVIEYLNVQLYKIMQSCLPKSRTSLHSSDTWEIWSSIFSLNTWFYQTFECCSLCGFRMVFICISLVTNEVQYLFNTYCYM